LIETRFNQEVKAHYSFIDREKGGMMLDEGTPSERLVPLMTIAIGVVTSERQFYDIREVTEAAAEARRRAATQQANRA